MKQNTIYTGDCLELMKDIPEKSIGLVLCDLPYGITHNLWDKPLALDVLWDEYRRIVCPSGYVILFAQGLFIADLMASNRKQFSHKLVWVKSRPRSFLNANKMPLKQHEDILVFRMGTGAPYYPQYTFGHAPYTDRHIGIFPSFNYGRHEVTRGIPLIHHNDGRRHPVDVIQVPASVWDKSPIHPTQKPIELGRYLIRQYSNPNTVVLDNCCGSGSFLIAAMLENRPFIGIEADPSFSSAAFQRKESIRLELETHLIQP